MPLSSVCRKLSSVSLFANKCFRGQSLFRRSLFGRSQQRLANARFAIDQTSSLKLDGDKILYKSDKGSDMMKLHIYSAVCGLLSIYSSGFLYLYLRKANEDRLEQQSKSVQYLLKANNFLVKYKWLVCGFFAVFGATQFALMCSFIKRNVHSIILKKNGKESIIRIYNFIPQESKIVSITVPLKNICCLHGRNENVSYMSLAIAGRKRTLLLDKRGTFPSPSLFDATVGIYRKIE